MCNPHDTSNLRSSLHLVSTPNMPPTATKKDSNEDDDWDKIFAGGATGGGIESIIPTDLSGEDLIRPDDNAIDFEDEDELAEDEDELAEEEVPTETKERHGSLEASENENSDEEIDIPDFFAHHRGGSLSINAEGISLAGELDGGQGFNDNWFDELSAEGRGDMSVDSIDHNKKEREMNEDEEDLEEEELDDPMKVLHAGSSLLHDTDAMLETDLIEEINTIDDKITDEQLLKAYYPGFKTGAVLKMNTIFGPKPSKLLLPKPKPIKQLVIPTKTKLEVEPDQKRIFRYNLQKQHEVNNGIINVSLEKVEKSLKRKAIQEEEEHGLDSNYKSNSNKEIEFASADWNIFEDDSESDTTRRSKRPRTSSASQNTFLHPSINLFNTELYNSDEEEALLEGVYRPLERKPHLDMNDSNLLFIDQSRKLTAAAAPTNITTPINESQLHSRYNISNDKAYDMLKENYQSKVRATVGNLSIDHSMVALRLQSPHYKVKLSKSQMRSFHRPSFVVKPNTTIMFSKIKQRKKKKDKGKHITQILNKTGDLSLGDSAQFFLLEYCEEFPIVLSCFGMGSKLINYYRKRSVDDAERPKLPIGETHVLGVQDKSAFWNFGLVDRGTVVPTLYNRMVRAPIFQHEPKSTDFLLVRSTGGGVGQKYFLRALKNMFVVGQTFPVTAIPGPHSRKVTTASKNRLKMVVYRVLNKSDRQRLQVGDISGHFPDQNDMQNRQRLKEFMEFQRSGDDQRYWKIKTGDTLPPEDSIRSMITPEDIVLLESMQVGQQHLEDAGYGKTVEDDQEDADGMSIEEQLAPWNISRNFINATQGKAMLQLHGEGDPSGRGEGFSFLRTSMKGGFRAMGESVNDKLGKATKLGGHSYNVASQQKAYDEEIKRIWNTQRESLSISDVSELGWDEAEHNRDNPENTGDSSANTPAPTSYDKDDDEMSLFSHNSASNTQQTKVLKITRLVKDENDVLQQKVELVRDPNVIRAYVKRRQLVEDSQLVADDITVTNDEERNKRHRKILEDEVNRIRRNIDRRLARKAQKANNPTTKAASRGKATTRKCATCGAVGHIKTNKTCPMYNEANNTSGGGTPTSG